MNSSALEDLVYFAQAIEDGDLKLANSFLEQIWNLIAVESDEPQSKVMKYFAEALVRNHLWSSKFLYKGSASNCYYDLRNGTYGSKFQCS